MSRAMACARSVTDVDICEGIGSWTIHHFADLDCSPDNEIVSAPMVIAGKKWIATLYPGGTSTLLEPSISVYMGIAADAQPANAMVTASIRSPTGAAMVEIQQSQVRTFEEDEEGWGWDEFVERRTVLKSMLFDGALTLEFKIRVIGEPTEVLPLPILPPTAADGGLPLAMANLLSSATSRQLRSINSTDSGRWWPAMSGFW